MGPVIGASVVVKGTTNGVITDFDGNFSLSGVKKGDIIEISFVGYETQIVKWDGKPINVTLKEDTKTLDEVVVVGTGWNDIFYLEMVPQDQINLNPELEQNPGYNEYFGLK